MSLSERILKCNERIVNLAVERETLKKQLVKCNQEYEEAVEEFGELMTEVSELS